MQTKPYGTWESPLTVDEIYKPVSVGPTTTNSRSDVGLANLAYNQFDHGIVHIILTVCWTDGTI